ncbi:MAG: hypothetical protein G8237_06345 [Magnetococcales bacterium]|nr:hypothetical protein [Magnetococcales bacterium]
MRNRCFILLLVASVMGLASPLGAAEPVGSGAAGQGERPPFATVDGVAIPAEQFIKAVQEGMRQKYYHGKIPDPEMAKFQREMGNALVDRILFVKEAKKQGLQPDQSQIQQRITEMDQRYGNSPRYQNNREAMLGPMVEELADRSLVNQLKEKITKVKEPSAAELTAYYKANPDTFTEPEDLDVSLILLKVAPNAGVEAWDQAKGEAEQIFGKLKGGADFAEMARIHSGDPSAAKGGRMDYLHSGMLAQEAEKALSLIKPGEITPVILVLEGYAIFRLDKRTPPRKLTFEEARDRAKKLYVRDASDTQWKQFRKKLWDKASVKINESYYLPLTESGKEASGTPHPHALGGGKAK